MCVCCPSPTLRACFSVLVISLALSSACLLIPQLWLFSFINCGSVLPSVCPPRREPSVPHLEPQEHAKEQYLQSRLQSTQQVHSQQIMTPHRAQQHILSSELHPLVSGWFFIFAHTDYEAEDRLHHISKERHPAVFETLYHHCCSRIWCRITLGIMFNSQSPHVPDARSIKGKVSTRF